MNSKLDITFYGAEWCPDCRRSKALLNKLKVKYNYIDLEEVPTAADEVMKINKGMQSIPTIVFTDGSVLVEPSDEELENKIRETPT
jgi:glutaredoxin-like protein